MPCRTLQFWHIPPINRGCSRVTLRLPQEMQMSAGRREDVTPQPLIPSHLLMLSQQTLTPVSGSQQLQHVCPPSPPSPKPLAPLEPLQRDREQPRDSRAALPAPPCPCPGPQQTSLPHSMLMLVTPAMGSVPKVPISIWASTGARQAKMGQACPPTPWAPSVSPNPLCATQLCSQNWCPAKEIPSAPALMLGTAPRSPSMFLHFCRTS